MGSPAAPPQDGRVTADGLKKEEEKWWCINYITLIINKFANSCTMVKGRCVMKYSIPAHLGKSGPCTHLHTVHNVHTANGNVVWMLSWTHAIMLFPWITVHPSDSIIAHPLCCFENKWFNSCRMFWWKVVFSHALWYH